MNATLVETENNKLKNDTATELHQKFAHPLPEKLLNSAEDPRQSNKELKELIWEVSDECTIRKIY